MDRPKRQTATATPAKPGGLPLTLVNIFQHSQRWRSIDAAAAERLSGEARRVLPSRRFKKAPVVHSGRDAPNSRPIAADAQPTAYTPSLPRLAWLEREERASGPARARDQRTPRRGSTPSRQAGRLIPTTCVRAAGTANAARRGRQPFLPRALPGADTFPRRRAIPIHRPARMTS